MTLSFHDLLDPPPATATRPRVKPHCRRCGRWVPEASVRRIAHPEGPAEDDWTGTCATHGQRVDVVWDEG